MNRKLVNQMKAKRIVLTIAAIALATQLAACTQSELASEILEREGYTQIEIGDYAWWGCGEGDTYRTKFTALKNNRPVEGVVCSGTFKGATVRTFN